MSKGKQANGDQTAVIRKRQEEEDERYARELQKKLDRENGSPARGKKVEMEEPQLSEKYRPGIQKSGKTGIRISIRKGEQAAAQVHGLTTLSKYGRQRKLNRFLRQSDSDSSYGEKKRKPTVPPKG